VIVVGILGSSGDAVLEIATRCAATGARTEVVGAAPVGAAGDRLLLRLATARIGHATVTRTSVDPLGIEPADLDLALRYLPDVRVVVLVTPDPALLTAAAASTSFASATLLLVGPIDAALVDAVGSPSPIVLDPPSHDPDGAFAGLVATLAVRLESGETADAAWKGTVTVLAVDRA